MSSEKNLQKSIVITATKVQTEKVKLAEHKRYFNRLADDNRIVLLALLLPSFLMGWQKGKGARMGQRLKQLGQFIMLTLMANIRNRHF